jgi:hypothetical protein
MMTMQKRINEHYHQCKQNYNFKNICQNKAKSISFISFSFVNTIFSHFTIWEMEGLVKRYFKFIWWFVKFGGEVAPDVFEFQSRLN